jgi:hypothetical protein
VVANDDIMPLTELNGTIIISPAEGGFGIGKNLVFMAVVIRLRLLLSRKDQGKSTE